MGNALEGLLAFTAGGVSKAAKQVRENELLEIDRKEADQERRTKRSSEINQSLITLFGTGQFDPESLKFALSQVPQLIQQDEGGAAFELLETREQKAETPTKSKFNVPLFKELAEQVSSGERKAENAREAFMAETGRDLPFTAGQVKEAGGKNADLFFKFFDRGEKIKGDFSTVSQNLNNIEISVERMEQQKNDPNLKENRIALNQAIITSFNKITDPGSVVRESEYDRTPQGAPLINRLKGKIDKISKGGLLTPDDLIEIRDLSRQIAEGLRKHLNKRLIPLSNRAKKSGISDAVNFIPEFGNASTEESQQQKTSLAPDIKSHLKNLGF